MTEEAGPEELEDWRRLGRLLTARRAQLDPAYRNRKMFAEHARLNYRVLFDIEQGRRTNFGIETVAAVERAYGWTPGSVLRVLQGGHPTLVTADPFEDPGDLPAWIELEKLSAEEAQILSALTHFTVDERIKLALVARQLLSERQE